MIEARGLCMDFGGRSALHDVSFAIAEPGVVGLLGPNGAGKSTTMRLLAGALLPRAGGASICGHDVHRQRLAAQSRLGYLPETAEGFGRLTVREFLDFCASARGLAGAHRRNALVRACGDIDLHAALGRPLRELSKGWRQRAWLAQALLHDPPALILDEPTDGLDPLQKRQLRALISRLGETRAVLLSTHILEEAEQLCQRAIVMSAGRIVADAAIVELLDAEGRLAAAFHRLTATGAGEPVTARAR